ncbi:MAG: hypothetical protein JO348_13335, partial [Alphaproteobacteria bacterium]|nr:hypothetical protein [Alphaproteobacteria bacterium]
AETGLPVRPLAGSLAVAANSSDPIGVLAAGAGDATPSAATPPAQPPANDNDNDKKPGSIEDIINGLFGKGGT